MKSVEVKGTARAVVGKKDAKALRLDGSVPSVVYGISEAAHISVPVSELRKLIYTPNVYLVDLDVDGTVTKVIVKDVQFHPVSDEVIHVDFLRIPSDAPIKIDVPVALTGFAKGIQQGGKIKLNLRTLTVKALASNLPDAITLDVTELEIGQGIRVGEIETEGLEIVNAKSAPVVSIMITRAARAAMNAAE